MFLDALLMSFKCLTYWEVYVAAAGYSAILLTPLVISYFASSLKQTLWLIPFSVLAQLIGLTLFTITMSPIILGLGADAAWLAPFKLFILEPLVIIFLLIKLTAISIALRLIPFVNKVTSLQTLFVGGFVLCFSLDTMGINYPNPFPGFFPAFTIVFTGGVLSLLSSYVTGLITLSLDEAWADAASIITAPAFELAPLVIYAAWLGAVIY